MNQQPDKLFREKLDGFTRPVSASAWNRVETGLDKKNNKPLWLKIAAAVTLLAVAAFVLWPTEEPSTVQTLSEKKAGDANNVEPRGNDVKETPKESPAIIEEKAVEPSLVAERKSVAPKQRTKSRKKKTTDEPTQNVIEKVEQSPSIAEHAPEVVTLPTEVVVADGSTTTSALPSTPQDVNTPTHERVRIVYSAEEINDKYLDKKSLAEATSDEKKPSTLRKLIDKAYDLKNNEDPFADLRQKKNEILALNFRNDKQQRSENK